VLIRAGKHHVKRMVDADGRLSSPVDAMRQVRQRRVVRMIGLHKTNKRSIDELDEDDAEFDLDRKHRRGNPPHQLQLHGPAQQESPEPVANDAATEPDVEVLDSPADADEFHDAIEQMDRQIDQLERPPDSPFSYAPTTPAETVIGENDEPNTNDNANANTTATLPADMPADADLPPVPTDDESDGHDDPSKAVNTLPGAIPPAAVNTLPASAGGPSAADNTVPADTGDDRFRQRRRRMDQGKMAWLRDYQSQRRPHEGTQDDPEKKRKKIQNSVEVGFYSVNGEPNKFPADMLPEGWTYDEVSNTFMLIATEDFWSVEDGFLVRNHVIACKTSWRPTADAIKKVPIKLGDLQSYKDHHA